MSVALARTAEMAAVFMIGDGLLGLLQPERHVDLWRSRVGAVDALVRPFGDRPARRRAYGLLQIAAGVLLASRQRAPHSAGRSIDQKRGPSPGTRHSAVTANPSPA